MTVREKIKEIEHLRNKYFICVLENPMDVMNIAATIRNVSAFGVEKLYVVGNKGMVRDFESSRKNKRLTNLSVGANKWVFVKHFETTAECITHLKINLYTIAVTTSHKKEKVNTNLYDGDFTQKRLAVWFGNEAKGVSVEAIKGADMCIKIPMGGIVESLNLGTSTGIILSYIGYQRLKFVHANKKVPKNMRSKPWDEFINIDRK